MMIVSRDPLRRVEDGIEMLPIPEFLRALWAREVI